MIAGFLNHQQYHLPSLPPHAGDSAGGSFPLVSLRFESCAGAWTTHLGCKHDAKEDQASCWPTHFHRCLAAEILSRIWTWDQQYQQLRASSPTIQWWVEPRSSCRAYTHLTDMTTSTSFQRISGLLKSTDSASCKPTSDCYAVLRCWHLEKDCLVCQWIWLYFHLKRIG